MAKRSRTLGFLAGLVLVPAAAGSAAADLGFEVSAKKAPSSRTTGAADGAVATLPGFEMLADGASRLFVELTRTVDIEEKKVGHRVTYVLKGAHVQKRNNENALETVHFNTPVRRARLLPGAGGLVFIVDLRADATPTWKMNPGKDNTAILEVLFPKGDYLPARDADQPVVSNPDGAQTNDGSDDGTGDPPPPTPPPTRRMTTPTTRTHSPPRRRPAPPKTNP